MQPRFKCFHAARSHETSRSKRIHTSFMAAGRLYDVYVTYYCMTRACARDTHEATRSQTIRGLRTRLNITRAHTPLTLNVSVSRDRDMRTRCHRSLQLQTVAAQPLAVSYGRAHPPVSFVLTSPISLSFVGFIIIIIFCRGRLTPPFSTSRSRYTISGGGRRTNNLPAATPSPYGADKRKNLYQPTRSPAVAEEVIKAAWLGRHARPQS